MSVKLNKVAKSYAENLIRRGKVDRDSSWEFSTEDGDKLLGPDGDDWERYGKAHLGEDPDEPEDTKAHWKYPVMKNTTVHRHAVIAAKSRAAQQGATAIEEAADALLQMIDAKKDSVEIPRSMRVDFLDFRDWQTEKMTKTHDGFYQGRTVVTNIGVFPYANPDGSFRYELRHPDEVMKPESLRTLEGKPLTNDHPVNGVTPTTARFLQVGSVYAPERDAYHLTTGYTITDADAIRDVQMGKRSLSCGYDCDVEEQAGVYLGMPYTHVQKNIRYNHVALVDAGRAGDAAKLRMDGITAMPTTQPNTPKNGSTTMKIRMDRVGSGAEMEVDALVGAEINALRGDITDLKSKADAAEAAKTAAEALVADAVKKADTAQGELDGLKSHVATLEAKLATSIDASEVGTRVKARAALEGIAATMGIKLDDADLSDTDIKIAVIKLSDSEFKADGLSDAYLDARFDGVVTQFKKFPETLGVKPADAPGGSAHGDSASIAAIRATAKKAQLDRLHNAYKREK